MREKRFFYKKGRRYFAINEYIDGFFGLPSDGLLYKHKSGMSCFLHPKKWDKDLDIKKLCYFETKISTLTKKLYDDNVGIYNISTWEFCDQILKKICLNKK